MTVRSASNPGHADTAVDDPDDTDEDNDGFEEVALPVTQPVNQKKRGRLPGSMNKNQKPKTKLLLKKNLCMITSKTFSKTLTLNLIIKKRQIHNLSL